MKHESIGAALSLVLVLATTAHAETWQVGTLAESGGSPFIGARQESSVTPFFNYIDERFSFVGGELHYELISGKSGHLDIVGQMRAPRFYSAGAAFGDSLGIDGMEDRDPAFELGLGSETRTAWGQFAVAGVLDVTGVHEGFELTAEYSYPNQAGQWLIEPGIGAQFQSKNLVDYYHGVKVSEARDGRPAYEADQALNTFASLVVGYTINARVLAVVGTEQITLDSSIRNSPIVTQRQVRKVYLGLIYTF